MLDKDELIEIVLGSLSAERDNNITVGKTLMHTDYRKTSMYLHKSIAFPVLEGEAMREAMTKSYSVKGREFHIYNMAANEQTQTVFLELAELEPRAGEHIIWPYVMVCYIEDGKIKRTRHYGDPALMDRPVPLELITESIES